jgi:hypothetical protein
MSSIVSISNLDESRRWRFALKNPRLTVLLGVIVFHSIIAVALYARHYCGYP